MPKIELVDAMDCFTVCVKTNCDETLMCVRVSCVNRSVEGVAASLARAFYELTRPSSLAPMAQQILARLEAQVEGGN